MCAPRVFPALDLTGGDEKERIANFLLFPSETEATQPETQIPVTLRHRILPHPGKYVAPWRGWGTLLGWSGLCYAVWCELCGARS